MRTARSRRTHLVFAVTGASGAPIALRLLEVLLGNSRMKISLIMSRHALEVLRVESRLSWGDRIDEIYEHLVTRFRVASDLSVYDESDMSARVSSGSCPSRGMIIAPCSMNTLAAIAHGMTLNLIQRVASVMLKEKRPLYLVPRESPLSPVHLKNMLELSQIGVHIIPATTAFYFSPKNVQDMVDFVAARVLDLAGIPHKLSRRWRGPDRHCDPPEISGGEAISMSAELARRRRAKFPARIDPEELRPRSDEGSRVEILQRRGPAPRRNPKSNAENAFRLRRTHQSGRRRSLPRAQRGGRPRNDEGM